jgi:hypothetical protein
LRIADLELGISIAELELGIWDKRDSLECGGKRWFVTLLLPKAERDTALDCGSRIADLCVI